MALGLFICLFIAFFLLCAPLSEYEVSPVMSAVDAVKKRLLSRYDAGDKKEILKILGRSVKDVIKTGIVTGVGLGFLALILTFKFLGPFSVIPAVVFLIFGILLTDKVLQGEFKRWQSKLADGIPTLVNFMPAFLEIEGVTPREALSHTIAFLPDPLRSEMQPVVNKIARTGRVREATDELARRAKHPLIDAICFRLSAAWDAKVTSDIFADLSDQVEEAIELSVSRATAAKTGYLALICVLGLIGMMLIFGYPGGKYLLDKLAGGFGMS